MSKRGCDINSRVKFDATGSLQRHWISAANAGTVLEKLFQGALPAPHRGGGETPTGAPLKKTLWFRSCDPG